MMVSAGLVRVFIRNLRDPSAETRAEAAERLGKLALSPKGESEILSQPGALLALTSLLGLDKTPEERGAAAVTFYSLSQCAESKTLVLAEPGIHSGLEDLRTRGTTEKERKYAEKALALLDSVYIAMPV